MEPSANKEKLQQYLKRKEIEAQSAKQRGMQTTYGNLLLEINIVKTKLKKFNMGSK